jgi:hypothetical protein
MTNAARPPVEEAAVASVGIISRAGRRAPFEQRSLIGAGIAAVTG